MDTKISHSGIVESISDGCVQVRILQTSACAACKVAGHCHASESKEKIVDVLNVHDTNRLKVGDSVTVCASRDVHVPVLALVLQIRCHFCPDKLKRCYFTRAIRRIVPATAVTRRRWACASRRGATATRYPPWDRRADRNA